MTCKVKFSHSGKSTTKRHVFRDGKIVYRHPEGRFVVVEFHGVSGKFREAFWPEDIEKQDLFL